LERKLTSGTVPRKEFSDLRINPIITWTQIFLRRNSFESLRSVNSRAPFESFIQEGVAEEDFDSRFSSSHTTRPVDSPPALEKPLKSSVAKEELEIDMLPLRNKRSLKRICSQKATKP